MQTNAKSALAVPKVHVLLFWKKIASKQWNNLPSLRVPDCEGLDTVSHYNQSALKLFFFLTFFVFATL